MKKLLFVLVVMVFGCSFSAYSQGYIFVNSEQVFKSIAQYNTAITDLDNLAEANQKLVDDATTSLDEMYNNYQAQKSYLSQTGRTTREEEIVNREHEINEFRDKIFGQNGDLMKKRVELIKPIQERVFATINKYAEANGYNMVVDIVNNQTLLYYSPALNKTEDIIKILKQ